MSTRLLIAPAAFAACNSAPRTSETPSAAVSDSMPLRFAPSNGVITVNFGTLRTCRTPATPRSDQGRAFGLVTAHGYTILMGGTRVRLIHLPEVPSTREVMLVYFESDPGAATDPRASLLTQAADGITLRSR